MFLIMLFNANVIMLIPVVFCKSDMYLIYASVTEAKPGG